MARHKKLISDQAFDADLDISSLIDVCFLLLIYFLVTSTITPRERDLGLSVPSKTESDHPQPPIPPMTLRIDAQGAVIAGIGNAEQILDVDAGSRELPLLASHLELYAAAARSASDEPTVLLSVDENVRQQRMIDVFNAFAAAGIQSVAFNDLTRL